MKTSTSILNRGLLAALLTLSPLTLPGQQSYTAVELEVQWADSPAGPWADLPPGQSYPTTAGSILAWSEDPEKFFRIIVGDVVSGEVEQARVAVDLLPRETVDIAAKLHEDWIADYDPNAELDPDQDPDPDGDNTNWIGAKIAPVAIKVYDPCYRDGKEPAFIEFKMIREAADPGTPVAFLQGNETQPCSEVGYILVSLHEGEAPTPEFNQHGPTPCEKLLAQTGNPANAKIMRYGPTFMAVENERGELLAHAGADPFQIPAEANILAGEVFTGEFDSEVNEEPPADGDGGPLFRPIPYRDYAAFKADFLANPVYQGMRARKAAAVAWEWDLLRGIVPPEPVEFVVEIGQRLPILSGENIIRYLLDDDENDERLIATINRNRVGGGLTLTGNIAGGAPLLVETEAGITTYSLLVVPAGAAPRQRAPRKGGFTPGWQPWKVTYASPDGYGGMARYHQTKSVDWCDKVGCGPVAWAILFHWWDHHGVPAAFYSFDNVPDDFYVADAPPKFPGHYWKMRPIYHELHDLCDVICGPTGAGATWPADMVEAGPGYLWIPRFFKAIGFKHSWAWDLVDPNWNEPSNRIRTAIKNGRPAIVGLGWLWHYGVAYGYRFRKYQLAPDTSGIYYQRHFKVNEGWGKAGGAWYSGYDTFLGSSIKAWQK